MWNLSQSYIIILNQQRIDFITSSSSNYYVLRHILKAVYVLNSDGKKGRDRMKSKRRHERNLNNRSVLITLVLERKLNVIAIDSITWVGTDNIILVSRQ